MIVLSVLNTFAAAVAMAAVAWIGLRVFRANAATRYWTWWAVLAALMAMLGWPQRVEPVASTIPVATRAVAPIEIAPRVDWFLWLALAWAVFAAYRLLRIAVSYAHLRRIIRNARPIDTTRVDILRAAHGVARSTQFLESNEISSPMSAGYLRASIVLPEAVSANLTPEQLDHVLLHELAHVARRDDWTKLAARLTGAFLGLHPVAAFALSRIEKEREHACDDWVAAATGDARAYAASLARVFELSRGSKHVLASGMAGSSLGSRVTRLLSVGHRFTRRVSFSRFLAIAAALLGVALIASHSPALIVLAQGRLPATPAPPKPPASAAPGDRSKTSTPAIPVSAPASSSSERFLASPCVGASPAPGCPDLGAFRAQMEASAAQAIEERDRKLRDAPELKQLYQVMELRRQELLAAFGKTDRTVEMQNYEQARQEYFKAGNEIAGPFVLYVTADILRRLEEK